MMGGLKSTMGGIGALNAPQNDGGLKSTMGGIGALNAPQNDGGIKIHHGWDRSFRCTTE